MPISKRPDDAKVPAYGEFGPFVGMAAFNSLRYGDYLIGLNTTEDRSYTLAVPPDAGEVTDLVTGKTGRPNGGINVAPLSTVVLDLGGSLSGAAD